MDQHAETHPCLIDFDRAKKATGTPLKSFLGTLEALADPLRDEREGEKHARKFNKNTFEDKLGNPLCTELDRFFDPVIGINAPLEIFCGILALNPDGRPPQTETVSLLLTSPTKR
jgi:hypothetical protein